MQYRFAVNFGALSICITIVLLKDTSSFPGGDILHVGAHSCLLLLLTQDGKEASSLFSSLSFLSFSLLSFPFFLSIDG